MKILLTGAHFTPAVAVIEELKKQNIEVVYVGRKTTQEGDSSPSAESKVLPQLGIKYIPIITGRLQRFVTIHTIPSLLKIPVGFIQALYIILKEKPDLILSFGGYVAVPLVFAGWLMSIPIIVHEQTLVSGLANSISAFFADKIALSFNQVQGFDRDKVIITGNPIRKMVTTDLQNLGSFNGLIQHSKKDKLPIILVTGGNQGSHIINTTVEQILGDLTKIAFIIHVTGENKFKDFERLQQSGNFKGRYLVKRWIGEEYGAILKRVDLVVSRSGINTLSELAYVGKPALVIPFEPLYKDEQIKNANFFKEQGLVKVLAQSKLSPMELLKNIKEMLKELETLKEKTKNTKKVIIQDAAKRLSLEAQLLAKK